MGQLPTVMLTLAAAIRSMTRGASCPDESPTKVNQSETRCTASCLTPIQPAGWPARARSTEVQKRATWCMIQVWHTRLALRLMVQPDRATPTLNTIPVAAIAAALTGRTAPQ
jgi:hypothetical protein